MGVSQRAKITPRGILVSAPRKVLETPVRDDLQDHQSHHRPERPAVVTIEPRHPDTSRQARV